MRLSSYSKMSFVAGFLLVFLAPFPPSASCQTYPDKPITIYCGFVAGASTDMLARALASGAEKLLGVPVVVENKPGGGTTVCAAIVASKKPDGYLLGALSEGALTSIPHIQKVGYNPVKDFTYLSYYANYLGVVAVHKDSPFKTIEELIAYAKANPGGLSYSSTGMYTRQHLAMELLSEYMGLTFKHVPTKGATEASTMLHGKHVDFSVGSSQIIYVKTGQFRLLMMVNAAKRNPLYPDIPISKDFGCPDVPPAGLVVVGPKGIPPAISKKLGDVFKKVTEDPAFQKVLASFDLPYDYKDQAELEKKIPADYRMYEDLMKKIGATKKD